MRARERMSNGWMIEATRAQALVKLYRPGG